MQQRSQKEGFSSHQDDRQDSFQDSARRDDGMFVQLVRELPSWDSTCTARPARQGRHMNHCKECDEWTDRGVKALRVGRVHEELRCTDQPSCTLSDRANDSELEEMFVLESPD